MKLHRIYTGEDNHTHFGTITIDLNDQGEIGCLSDRFPAESVIFRTNEGTYDFDFHHAPQRQLIVLLEGEIESENILGETRRYKAGDIVLVEDTWGSGHKTKSIDGQHRRSLFIPVGDTYFGEPDDE